VHIKGGEGAAGRREKAEMPHEKRQPRPLEELTVEELERQEAAELPDRDLLSLIASHLPLAALDTLSDAHSPSPETGEEPAPIPPSDPPGT